MEDELVGKYFVKPTGPAVVNAWKLCKYRAGEYWKLRRHAFNLAYWPEGADLDWEWIRGFENLKIGELRIDEPINDIENIRVIFYKSDVLRAGDRLPYIWLLHVFAKKSQGFKKGELEAFKAKRQLLIKREYDGSASA